METIKKDEVIKALKIFKGDNDLIEIRILGHGKDKGFTLNGVFDTPEQAVDAMIKANITKQVCFYFVLNEIDRTIYKNDNYGKIKKAMNSARDSEIKKYKWIYFDIDPERASGTASTDAQLNSAWTKALQVYKYLKTEGWQEPVIALSANGYHLLYKVDFDNTPDNVILVKRLLEIMSDKFSDEYNKIDTSVYNPARICKLYGTLSQKGDNFEDRPYRFCEILQVPDEIKINDVDVIKKIAVDFTQKEKQYEINNAIDKNFNLEDFINKHGINVKNKIVESNGTIKYVLERCFFNEEHTAPDAALFQMPNGMLGYKCFHAHCQGYHWQDVRKLFEPDAYNNTKKDSSKKEMHDDKKLFYDYSEIKLNYGEKDRCLTGIKELDKLTKGFTYNSVTLWAAQTNAGKTTLLSMLATAFIKQGRRVLYFAGEQTKEDFKNDFQLQLTPKNHIIARQYQQEDIYDYYVDEQAREVVDNKLSGNLFIYNNEAPRDIETIIKAMEEAQEKYFVRDFVIDNLMQIDNDNADLYRGQEKIAETLRKFAIDKKCNIHLVAHSRKTTGNSIRLTLFDVAGTQNISNKAYNIITLTRTDQLDNKNPEYEKLKEDCAKRGYALEELDAVLEVIKTKGKGVGIVGLKYEPITKTYSEVKRRTIEYKKKENYRRRVYED